MGILSAIQRRMESTILIITVPMLPFAMAAVLLISVSAVAFAYYLSPIHAYSQTEPASSNPLYNSVVSSNSSEQRQVQQPQSKVIEASGHFANNQIENDSVSWIQGGLWHLVVYNSLPSSTPNSTTGAKAIFSGNF